MKLQKRAKICLCVSLAIMVIAAVLSLCGLGINFGIDFAGGLNIQYDMGAAFEQADVEEALRSLGISEFTVSSSGTDGSGLQIRVPALNGEDEIQTLQSGLEEALLPQYPNMNTDTATASYVGPVAGKVLIQNAVWSVVIASALMLIYIAIRFDLASGLAAVIGLVHDVLMMLAFMVILRSVVQMNSSYIAAMLTIVGYSINNTIIIFDRVRENKRKLGEADRDAVVETSVKECLGRTINTTLTTLVTILALYILGVSSIKEFCLPIIVGILSGAYSANLINGYVWAALEGLFAGKKQPAKAARAQA